jgi:hypothetical protein
MKGMDEHMRITKKINHVQLNKSTTSKMNQGEKKKKEQIVIESNKKKSQQN